MTAEFPWARLLFMVFIIALFLAWAVIYAASRRRDRPEQRGFDVQPKDRE